MPTQDEALNRIAATDEQRLATQKVNDERFLGNQTKIAEVVQDSFPLQERNTDAAEGTTKALSSQAQSVSAMTEAIAEMVSNFDQMKADQRDMALLMATCLNVCAPTLSTASKPETIKKVAGNAALMFDIAWTGIQARVKH